MQFELILTGKITCAVNKPLQMRLMRVHIDAVIQVYDTEELILFKLMLCVISCEKNCQLKFY